MTSEPLDGYRVLLTRTPEDSAAWAGPLADAGAEVTSLPCIRTEVIDDAATRDALAASLPGADWLILTSRRGVDALAALGMANAVPSHTRIAAVGKATGAAARDRLGRVDLVSTGGTAARLSVQLIDDPAFAPGQQCLSVVAENAGPTLERALTAAGAVSTRVDAYRTISHPAGAGRLPLSGLGVDGVVFSSPTTVHGFVNQISLDTGFDGWSIGPSTSAAMRETGLPVTGEAHEPSIAGIILAIGNRERRAIR